jgi:hypothetical protein
VISWFVGGHWTDGEQWEAVVTHGDVVTSVGSFDSTEDAAIAHDRAARKAFGDLARTNFSYGSTSRSPRPLLARIHLAERHLYLVLYFS